MGFYTVVQVAEMLGTNGDTVRRWIREGKLNAIQPLAKKEGLKITEEALSDFVAQTPKFIPKYEESKVTGIGTIAGFASGLVIGGIVAGALLSYFKKRKDEEIYTSDFRVTSEEFKAYLSRTIEELDSQNQKDRDDVRKKELEIAQRSLQIEQYRYLLNNEELLTQELAKNNKQ